MCSRASTRRNGRRYENTGDRRQQLQRRPDHRGQNSHVGAPMATVFRYRECFSQGPATAIFRSILEGPDPDRPGVGAPGVIAVTPNLPVRSVRELIEYSKQNPTKLNYASSGVGSASHLQTELLMNLTGASSRTSPTNRPLTSTESCRSGRRTSESCPRGRRGPGVRR
jgi:hypothetical protein